MAHAEWDMTEGYKRNWSEALEFSDFVMEQLWLQVGIPLMSYESRKCQTTKGENRNGIEIKHDKKFRGSGNLYIEVDERCVKGDDALFVPSGIRRDDNTWLWAIGDYETIYLLSKRQLLYLYNEPRIHYPVVPSFNEAGDLSGHGMLLPVADAEGKYATHILTCK